MEGFPEVSRNNWKFGVQGKNVDEAVKAKSRLTKPVTHQKIKTQPADKAYRAVLSSAGASLHRDDVDQRITEEAKTGTEQFGSTYLGGNKGIIDDPADVGGWPELKSALPPVDSDLDGMPDYWELLKGLNPENANDGNLFKLDKCYSNLEVYLNSLVLK